MLNGRTAKQTADLMGLSVKALRLYEARGLISPGRTVKGWRVYGSDEIERLHKVLALKSIGFSLADIASLLSGGIDLADILDAQREALEAKRSGITKALAVLVRAENRLKAGETLSADDLIHLTQETTMTDYDWTDAHDALARKHYTPEQMKELAARKLSPEMQEQIGAKWQELIDEAETLRNGPADSPEAIDLARRWMALANEFTGGDSSMNKATADWYQDGFSNEDSAKLMPFSKEVRDFIGAAAKHLK